MHYLLDVLVCLLRRGPIAFSALAVAVLGAGVYLQIGENERNAARVAAIAAGPPPVVEIAKFDRDQHMTGQREVVVRAQPMFELANRLTYSRNTGDDFAYMVPLIAPNAADDKAVLGIALYTSSSFTFDDITPELMTVGLTGFGNYGPVLEMNGRVSSLGKWQGMTDEAFVNEGLTLASNAVIVKPYLNGREAALAPSNLSVFDLFSYIAGALGLIALAKLVIRKDSTDMPEMPEAAPVNPPAFQPAADLAARSAPRASTVPLWRQRAGLLDKADIAAHVTSKPATFETPHLDPTLTQLPAIPRKQSGLSVRKILVGIVSGLFLLGLATTVIDLISNSSNAQVVAAPTVEEIFADGVADAIVPDADPDRHWTDIDIGPMVERVVAKGLMAIQGDTEAQILLASIVGGLIFLMFVLRYFWLVRGALKSKSHSSFSDLYSR